MVEYEGYRQTTEDNWADLKDFFRAFPDEWMYRGQRKEEWSMSTTLERCNVPDLAGAEGSLIRNFKSKAHLYLDQWKLPAGREMELEWLALMQHHGAPTRLLDFTESAYIAAFFAIEQLQSEDETCAVWAVNGKWCRAESTKRVAAWVHSEGVTQPKSLKSDALFHDCYYINEVHAAVPLQPTRFSQRLAIQQGCFLCAASVTTTFSQNLFEQTRPLMLYILLVLSLQEGWYLSLMFLHKPHE